MVRAGISSEKFLYLVFLCEINYPSLNFLTTETFLAKDSSSSHCDLIGLTRLEQPNPKFPFKPRNHRPTQHRSNYKGPPPVLGTFVVGLGPVGRGRFSPGSGQSTEGTPCKLRTCGVGALHPSPSPTYTRYCDSSESPERSVIGVLRAATGFLTGRQSVWFSLSFLHLSCLE